MKMAERDASLMHSITIEPTKLGEAGQRYRVNYAGNILVDNSRYPEFDACRALLALGLTGKVEVWRQRAAFPAMRIDIERGARLTISETEDHGPRMVRWRPAPTQELRDADPRAPHRPPVAVSELAAT
jgi:hypothetical protein